LGALLYRFFRDSEKTPPKGNPRKRKSTVVRWIRSEWIAHRERGFDSCSPTLVGKVLGVRFERKLHTA